ncbi:MAG: hypothetical protein IH911_09060 [Proteobacteria bacterium]|nr:hypothetical protein [Pseudomonadota bacterium]
MTDTRQASGRLQLSLMAAVFFGPLIFAVWLYFAGGLIQPSARSNHGALLEPILNLNDELPDSKVHDVGEGGWLLLYASRDQCGDACHDALFTIRQSRLLLGKDMDRIKRVFLHGDITPDTLCLADEHKGLVMIEDAELHGVLTNKKPAGLPAGGYYLIDPFGNLVMYFGPDIDPRDMVDDIGHLLRLSRIG